MSQSQAQESFFLFTLNKGLHYHLVKITSIGVHMMRGSRQRLFDDIYIRENADKFCKHLVGPVSIAKLCHLCHTELVTKHHKE